MLHLHCPNIKTEILELRSKIGELEGLKRVLLQGDTVYENKFETTKSEIEELVLEIDNKIDSVGSETVWYIIYNLGKYQALGNFYQGRAWVRDYNGNFFHILLNGKPAYEKMYKEVEGYDKGKAWVIDHGGNGFYIDLEGNRITY
jgi:hypothetical protein